MLDSIHKQGYYISSCSLIDFGGVFGVTIYQISSATFLRPGAWVAMVTSAAAIGRLESTYFYVINIIVLNGFVSFLFYFAANI